MGICRNETPTRNERTANVLGLGVSVVISVLVACIEPEWGGYTSNSPTPVAWSSSPLCCQLTVFLKIRAHKLIFRIPSQSVAHIGIIW